MKSSNRTQHKSKGLLGPFLVITALSALVAMWAVNSVSPIPRSPISLPILGILFIAMVTGLFVHRQS